jgi:hypothetical protein
MSSYWDSVLNIASPAALFSRMGDSWQTLVIALEMPSGWHEAGYFADSALLAAQAGQNGFRQSFQ